MKKYVVEHVVLRRICREYYGSAHVDRVIEEGIIGVEEIPEGAIVLTREQVEQLARLYEHEPAEYFNRLDELFGKDGEG